MKKIYLFSLLLLLVGSAQWAVAQSMRYHRIQVVIAPEKLEKLFNSGLEIDHFSYENKRNFMADVSERDVALFQRNGVKVTYLIKDLEKNYAAINTRIDREAVQQSKSARAAAVSTPANFSLGSYAGFYTYADIPGILDRMRALYPNLISVRSSIGSSTEGRPLYMVKISDNPDVDENEPELLLNALHHAREPMSLSQLIFFMWHMLENYGSDKEIRTLLNSSEIYILPCANPDGYVYNQTTNPNGGGMWRKNRRANANGTFGIDLNRNYSYNYGLDNTGSSPTPSADTYRGTGAFSEAETSTIRTFVAQHQFGTTFNYHSYANVCIYPFESLNPNNNPEEPLFKTAATYLAAENGFKVGNNYETIGYVANGTLSDWLFGERTNKNKIYGFTAEVGTSSDGFWPASSRIIPLSNTMIEMNRKFLRLSTAYGRATATQPQTATQTAAALAYQFQNFGIKPASFTVAATSLSSAVATVGPANVHSGLGLLQTTPAAISFTVVAGTPAGTSLPFELLVNNGLSVIKDTVTVLYAPSCGAPAALAVSNLGETSATLSWNAVSGATTYALSVKPKSATTWPADLSSRARIYLAAGLQPNTDYDWRVKPDCGTYATGTFKTLPQTCFAESGGQVVFEAESYRTAVAGTGSAAGRSWSPVSVSTASGGQAMTITGTNLNVQNSLDGPRLDYALNFSTAGTYYVWVRMAAGVDGIYDDSFHLGFDGTAFTLNPNSPNYNNGSTSWSWIKAAGSTAFQVTVSAPGSHTLNLWMREDGVRVDKFLLTTSASYTPAGTGLATSGACGTDINRVAASPARVGTQPEPETETPLNVLAYPNPFSESITVRVNPTGQNSTLRLINGTGRVVQQATLPGSQNELIMPTKTLPGGAYYLEVIRDNQRRVVPVVRQ